MGAGVKSADLIERGWQDFVTTGHTSEAAISPDILEAWQRCYISGVDPYDGVCYRFLTPSQLKDLLNKRKHLVETARPIMANLYEFVKNSGFIVLLTDERGYIMECLGDPDTMIQARKLNFIPGADWSEESVGTNAIGTAIVLGKPIQTAGAEHYCRKHQSWTCSATPIFDKNREMIGILDMSGPVDGTHLHTLGMVVAAGQAIVDQMRVQKKNWQLEQANERMDGIFRTISDGVVIINSAGIITHINPAAEDILGKPHRELTGLSISDILGRGIPSFERALQRHDSYSDIEVMVDTADGRVHCLSSGVPIMDNEGMLSGAVITFRPMEKVQKLVNRISGAQAVFHFKDIIGESPEMAEVKRLAALAAAGNSNVLLEGESGTGKEVIAQAIHNRSSRRKGPFVAVNCGAIPRELIASELFGYSEGAFTGAKRGGRPGKFELAAGGTLFLDEIGDMPLEQQVALLRVLQDKTITRIGDDKTIPVDFRIICATNKSLWDEVEKGNFRQDLYYRINVVSINIPSLRIHPQDIPMLFDHFMKATGGDQIWNEIEIDDQIIERLKQYSWPGNVRELQNVVERLIGMSQGNRIQLEYLPDSIYHPHRPDAQPHPVVVAQNGGVNVAREQRKQKIEEIERSEIAGLILKHGGNISEVAKEMGISRSSVYRKIGRYKIGLK
ncbi:MAG: sigma-54-dependent Fis family transcriptional regulator [Syntrophomonadaceae bacterium]